MDAMLSEFEHFGIGASWGGLQSIVTQTYPSARTVAPWTGGPSLRIHTGIEAIRTLSVTWSAPSRGCGPPPKQKCDQEMSELCDQSAVMLRRMIGEKKISTVELLASCRARIEKMNPIVNAIAATCWGPG